MISEMQKLDGQQKSKVDSIDQTVKDLRSKLSTADNERQAIQASQATQSSRMNTLQQQTMKMETDVQAAQ
jgi:hypothetical protein